MANRWIRSLTAASWYVQETGNGMFRSSWLILEMMKEIHGQILEMVFFQLQLLASDCSSLEKSYFSLRMLMVGSIVVNHFFGSRVFHLQFQSSHLIHRGNELKFETIPCLAMTVGYLAGAWVRSEGRPVKVSVNRNEDET